jgi:hypothetical protein
MNYTFKNITFSEKEFFNLKCAMGEFRRIVRDSVYKTCHQGKVVSEESLSHEMLTIAESIMSKINEVEWLNKNVK